jgi:hypothetical protein
MAGRRFSTYVQYSKLQQTRKRGSYYVVYFNRYVGTFSSANLDGIVSGI